jgi:serine phosphatase RsbU (regulator of sigma subunit)
MLMLGVVLFVLMAPSASTSTPRILVVDDEPTFINQTRDCLEQHGYDVVAARNGKDALAIADEGNVDLILLDIIMPVLNGVEVTKILKANPRTMGIPIIVVSTMTEYKERVEFFRIGANDYMPKPIDNGELIARVNLQLQVTRLRRQVEEANEHLTQKNHLLQQYVSRIEHDLAVARSLQRTLQPPAIKQLSGAAFSFEHISSEDLGSDYVDYLIDDGGVLHLIMADVSGHGIPSALLAAQFKVLFINTARKGRSLADVLGRLNRSAVNFLTEGYYFTAQYLQYEHSTGALSVGNAGHIPFLLYERETGKTKLVESTNTPLGFIEEEQYRSVSFHPKPGDLAVLLTDGLTEHRNEAGDMFEISRALDVVKRHADKTPSEIVKALIKASRDFGNLPLYQDDVTVCVLRFGDGEVESASGGAS